MTPDERKALLDKANAMELTWKGDAARVAGWSQPYATVTTRRPGFWACSWEAVEQAIDKGTFDGGFFWLASSAWLGY